MNELREACAAVSGRARFVRVQAERIADYAGALDGAARPPAADESGDRPAESADDLATFWITLDAINFGSGWFPTLRRRGGLSGYQTVATGLRERFAAEGPWSAEELTRISSAEIARVMDQDPDHELMALFAASLRDLGEHVKRGFGASFRALAASTGGSAVALARELGAWACFADVSSYEELRIPFLKRAQIAAADLHRAGLIDAPDLARLTMFADNLVPHVLRLDGILEFDRGLLERIEREELIEHGSLEEIEIRACALHAVELLVDMLPGRCAAELDEQLWRRGQEPWYKARPRHRSRCTAY